LNKFISKAGHLLRTFGFSPNQFLPAVKGIPYYFRNKKELNKQLESSGSGFNITAYYPCFSDRFDKSGSIPLHYFYQDLYVARKLYGNSPKQHVDIGSRIDGFVAHTAVFREIEVIDIRDIKDTIPNVHFIRADLMADNFSYKNYCDSVSCLHTIEHFGLGRYGDPVNVNGHIRGLKNITGMLKPGGRLYLSTVIGSQRIEFDAHRVFSVRYLLELVQADYDIECFSYIDDNNNFFPSAELTEKNIDNNFNCHYGCGIFELIKK